MHVCVCFILVLPFTLCAEYGPPLVKLNCSNEVYASMQSIPTGSLSPQEYENNLFIRWCYANWTCTNGTGFLQQPYTKLVRNLNQQY